MATETETLLKERGLPWESKETLEDSPTHNDVLFEAGITLLSRIGKGSFSTVWRGFWSQFSLPLALKIYDKLGHPAPLRSLPTEVAILGLTKHPYIISFFGAWETEFRVYLALELLDCGDLLRYLRTHGPVTESQAKTWLTQAASAVKYLHDLNIAHRDIKCENLLVDMNLNLRLTDFGFATTEILWDPSIPNSQWRKFNDYCGSAAYSSPEILMRVPYSPLLSDVWALGVVFYTSLFGLFPFDPKAKHVDPKEFPTEWRVPFGSTLSTDSVYILKRIFLLERRRIRAYELLRLKTFDEPSQLEAISFGEKAAKTVSEGTEEDNHPQSPTARQAFWGGQTQRIIKSRHECAMFN